MEIITINAKGSIYIYNMMGQEVATKKATGENLISLRITNGTGYYLVKVQTNDKIMTKKVFIR